MWWTLLACSSSLACSSCAEPPAPPQALSAKTRSVASSPTTSSAALALRLLAPLMPIFPSPHCCRRESLKRRPTQSWLLHRDHTPLWGQAYHSNRLSLVLHRHCLRVANFGELFKAEVQLRRIYLPRHWLSLSPMPDEERVLRRRHRAHPLQPGHLFDPVSVQKPSTKTIKILKEALRTQHRRAERVLEVYSPSILYLVSYLFDLHLFTRRRWG